MIDNTRILWWRLLSKSEALPMGLKLLNKEFCFMEKNVMDLIDILMYIIYSGGAKIFL